MNPKGISALPATLIIFTILALGIVGYFSLTAKQSAISSLSTVSTNLTNGFSNTNTAANSNADLNTNTVNANTSNKNDANGNTNATNVNANANATAEVTKDWKTYENKDWWFTLKFPQEWSVVTDTIQHKGESSLSGQVLRIGLETGGTKVPALPPMVEIWIDPTGWGSAWADKSWTIKKGAEGFTIEKKLRHSYSGGEGTLDYDLNVFEELETKSPRFFMTFISSTQQEDAAFDELVKQILSTFTFTR